MSSTNVRVAPRKRISWSRRTPIQSPSKRKSAKTTVKSAESYSTPIAKHFQPEEVGHRHTIHVEDSKRTGRGGSPTSRRSNSTNVPNVKEDGMSGGRVPVAFRTAKFREKVRAASGVSAVTFATVILCDHFLTQRFVHERAICLL